MKHHHQEKEHHKHHPKPKHHSEHSKTGLKAKIGTDGHSKHHKAK